ncbi:MAG TPA: YciI family protein [Thermoanaerobaculia bacterium]|nr:YciI family protein [Thermoanaerobaculia bacterium]
MRKPLGLAALLVVMLAAPPARSEEANIGPGGWEMTTYYVGFLYRGEKWTPEETPETKKLQEAHMANIQRMGAEGKLVVAGPFTDGGDLRGLYVFRAASAEEAKALVESDPAVKAGRLRFELHPWYAAKNITVTKTKEEKK